MDLVKIKNIKSGAIETVKKEIAGDYLATKEWVMADEKPMTKEPIKDFAKEPIFKKEEKNA